MEEPQNKHKKLQKLCAILIQEEILGHVGVRLFKGLPKNVKTLADFFLHLLSEGLQIPSFQHMWRQSWGTGTFWAGENIDFLFLSLYEGKKKQNGILSEGFYRDPKHNKPEAENPEQWNSPFQHEQQSPQPFQQFFSEEYLV